ncbi:hypothetical protein ECDEC3D_1579 [Escherichia coli DEC3D]|nr:hypothetical protein ECDEC3D_1579 [Escherichia coli DEC3D]
MTFKHYDVVRAASPSDLAEKLTHKLKEGWQPYGGPVAITPYTLMQAWLLKESHRSAFI